MAKRVGVDKWLFGTVLLLVLFGLVSVFSASAVLAKATLGSPYAYVIKQAGFALAGMVALFVLMRVDYRKYNNPKLIFPLMAVSGVGNATAVRTCQARDRAVSGVVSADAHPHHRRH
jgi:cell division protein FtsW